MGDEEINSLKKLLNIKRDGNYYLSSDIDCTKELPIERIIGDFRGTIDGRGHRIKGLMLSPEIISDGQPVALIHTAKNAVLRNLIIENLIFKIDDNGYEPKVSVLFGIFEKGIIEDVKIEMKDPGVDIPLIGESDQSTYTKVIFNNHHKNTLFKYSNKDKVED